MDNLTFIPKHRYNPIIGAGLLVLMAGISTYLMISGGITWQLVLLTMLFLGTLYAILKWSFRQLSFDPVGMVVSRYFLPDIHIKYTEFSRFDQMIIITKKGKISLFDVNNTEALLVIRETITTRGWLSLNPPPVMTALSHKTIERISRRTIFPATVFWIIYLVTFHQSPDSVMSVIIIIIIFIVLTGVVSAIRFWKAG